MKTACRTSLVAAALLSVLAFRAVAQTPATTAFTYQGRLMDNGTSPTALYDLQFKLFDALNLGNQVGSTVVVPAVQVTGGLFTASLDFGSQFNSQGRWLHIGIRPAGVGTFVTLNPRQPITAAPQANGIVLPMAATASVATDALTLTNTVGGGLSATGAGNGIDCVSTGANGNGISAQCNNGSLAYGVWGRSTTGYGVVGGGSSGAVGGAFTSDSGIGLIGQSASTHAVYGENGMGSGHHPLFNYGTGVWGDTDNGNGVAGTSGTAYGVYGLTGAVSGIATPGVAGVVGESHSHVGVVGLSNTNVGVSGYSSTSNGMYGRNGNGSALLPNFASGVWGDSDFGGGLIGTSAAGFGVFGLEGALSGYVPPTVGAGVWGDSLNGAGLAGTSSMGTGVYGYSAFGVAVKGSTFTGSGLTDTSGASVWGDATGGEGVFGSTSGVTGVGVYGKSSGANGGGVLGVATGTSGVAVSGIAFSSTGYAGSFDGAVQVFGPLSKPAGSFKIDHPIDPENKYLYHSFVESPDMKNIYDGVVTTDARGYATVTMPDWFQALNRDFRYQLTVINEAGEDEFVNAMIVRKLRDNQFTIRASRPNTEVSWQVTGIRQDAYANAHRIPVEEYKSPSDRGLYLYPTEQDKPKERGINWRKFSRLAQPENAVDGATKVASPPLTPPCQPSATTALSNH